jgi:hypothetical protein
MEIARLQSHEKILRFKNRFLISITNDGCLADASYPAGVTPALLEVYATVNNP